MANMNAIPFLEHLMELGEGEETIIVIHGQPFIVSKATDDDVERISHGYFCMD